jgi:hypothetical protein
VAKGIMVVQSAPADPSREDEYNEWYSTVHIPEILSIPGFAAARRYKAPDGSYLAVYELDDVGAVTALREHPTTRSDTLRVDPPAVVTVYELLE